VVRGVQNVVDGAASLCRLSEIRFMGNHETCLKCSVVVVAVSDA
jgi:hypothetical protein